jgi:hypothetical protein
MLQIRTDGNAFARGRQQGAACRHLALPWIDAALRELTVRLHARSSTELVQEVADEIGRYRRQTRVVNPDADEEGLGIAQGLGVSEAVYFTVLADFRLLKILPQCTTLGFLDADGRPILGKTDDLFQNELGRCVIEITKPEQGYRHLHFHRAGTPYTVAGMNECGLSLAMTGIPGPCRDEDGQLSLLGIHTILPVCDGVASAIEHIRALRINYYGFSLLMGDSGGNLALVEKTGAGTMVLAPQEGGFYLHTNHILDADFAGRNPAQAEPFRSNGQKRFENGRQIVPSLARDVMGMKAFLANRSDSGAICQGGEDGMYSDFRIIILPVEKRILLWSGCADKEPEESLDVTQLLA